MHQSGFGSVSKRNLENLFSSFAHFEGREALDAVVSELETLSTEHSSRLIKINFIK